MWIRIGKIFFLIHAILFAGELNFIATVDRTELGLGETIILTVSVQGEDIGSIPSPQLPDLPDFDIVGRSSSQSTSIQLINGKMSQQQTINFIYTLSPKKIGKSTIESCKLEFKGKTYQTQPITINVVKGTIKAPSKTPPSSGMTPSEPDVPIKENLKIVASSNRRSVYIGEQVTVEFVLYNRFNISDLNLAEMPSFSGFWVEPIYDAKRLSFQRKSIGGKLYDVCLIKKSALFPMTSGKLKISNMKMNVVVAQAPRDFFDFFGRRKTVQIGSEPIFIDVKPLPMEGKPEEFTGGVGKFTIDASLDRKTSERAEPINLIVKVSGSGNIRLIEKPNISSVPGVKILDPEIKENIKITDNRVKGYKEFHYPLIPQVDGEHIVPKIKIAYFNPRDKKYHHIETEELKFTATQTAAATEEVVTAGLKVVGTDIDHIKPDVTYLKSQKFSEGKWIIFLYLGSLLIISVALFYHKHQTRLLTDKAYARKLRSNRLVKKRLKEAERHLKMNDTTQFHASLSKTMLGYIGDRYNLDVSALTQEQLIRELGQKGIKEEIINKVIELLNQCDTIRFSPEIECKDPKSILETAKAILNQL